MDLREFHARTCRKEPIATHQLPQGNVSQENKRLTQRRPAHTCRAALALAQSASRSSAYITPCARETFSVPPLPARTTMKRLLTGTLLCLTFATAAAVTEPTEKDAIAMAERGASYIKAHGQDQLMKRLAAKDPDFVQGPLYIDIRDLHSGIGLALPARDHRAGTEKGQGLGRLPVQEPQHRQDRTEDHLHPARRRRGAGSGHLQEISRNSPPQGESRHASETAYRS